MIQNARILPKRYFGLHMLPGVAEYREPGVEPFRIFIGEETIKAMDRSFEGKPVYVYHVEDVNLEKLQTEADGYVVRSFFNSVDGKHWVEFLVVSDRGHEALAKGWRLSNAYIPKSYGPGGFWNGVEYQKEVTSGEYEHLAIVPNPRYDESVVFTPEQFREYNERKTIELEKLTNSKGKTVKFKWFRKEKVENAADLESMVVTLPTSKRELTVEQLVNEMDAVDAMDGFANLDHKVRVGEDVMSINELLARFNEMCATLKKNKEDAEAEEKKKDKAEEETKKENVEEEKKESSEEAKKEGSEKEEKKMNSDDPRLDDGKKFFDQLKNAREAARGGEDGSETVETPAARTQRGRVRYGSGK
jgi:hypothetical protein